MAVFHTPDGAELRVNVATIAALRPVTDAIKMHLKAGTQTIVYVTLKENFGVTENLEEVQEAIHNCIDGND